MKCFILTLIGAERTFRLPLQSAKLNVTSIERSPIMLILGKVSTETQAKTVPVQESISQPKRA